MTCAHCRTADQVRQFGWARRDGRDYALCEPCRVAWRARISNGLRRAYAEGQRPRYTRKWREWDEQEEALLRELVGTRPHAETAAALNRRFHRQRTDKAVESHALALGLSSAQRGLSQRETAHLFGVGESVVRMWAMSGLLVYRQHGQKRCFSHAAVRDFIRAHPWAYDWSAMTPGPERALAQVQPRWLSAKEAARALRTSMSTLGRWIAAEVIPAQRAHRNQTRIPAADLGRIRAEIEARRQSAPARRGAANRANRRTREAEHRMLASTGGIL